MPEDNLDRKYPKQTSKARKTVNRVMERLEYMRMSRNKHGDKSWDQWDRLYLNIPQREPEMEWQSNIFVPFVMSTVLAILAEITSRRTRWRLLPVGKEDEEKSETLEAITEFTLEKGMWDDESFDRDLDKLVYGTSVWKEVYREDHRVIKEPKTVNKETGEVQEWEEKDIREFNDVYGYHVPLRNFYLDDKAKKLRAARDCIERTIMDIRDFKTKYKKYSSSKKVKKYGFDKATAASDVIQNLPSGGDVIEEGTYVATSQMRENDVEVLEYWNKPNDEHIIIANGVLVVEEPIPYDHKQIPYAMDVCISKPNSAYGIGVAELLFPLQEELNTMHNMMLDEAHISIHPPIIMDGMTVLDETEYKLRPGAIIASDGGTASQIQMRGVTSSHFQMFEEIKQSARVASGLDVRFAEGVAPGGGDTATEVLKLQEASLRRIGLLTKVLEIKCLPRIGMLRTMNIQQFYKEPLRAQQVTTDADNIRLDEETGESSLKTTNRTIRVQKEGRLGYDFKEIKPEDIRGNFDVFVVPQSTQPMSEALIVKRLNVALNTVLASQVALQYVDVGELFKHFFKHLNLPEAIVKDILPIDQEADYQLAEQENQDMASGTDVKPTVNPSMQHTMIHAGFIYQLDEQGRQTGLNPQFESLPVASKQIFLRHIEGEKQQQSAKGNVSSDKTRTPNKQQGMGTQTVTGGAEIPATGGGV